MEKKIKISKILSGCLIGLLLIIFASMFISNKYYADNEQFQTIFKYVSLALSVGAIVLLIFSYKVKAEITKMQKAEQEKAAELNKELETTSEEEVKEEEEKQPEGEFFRQDLKISEKTYNEFVNRKGFWGQAKTTLIFCVILALFLWFTDSRAATAEVPLDVSKLLIKIGIWDGALIVITIGMYFVTKYWITPAQYKKSGISELTITVTISNLGIHQIIKDQKHLVAWTQLLNAEETETSLFLYTMDRRGMLFTIDDVSDADKKLIRKLIKTYLGNNNYKYHQKDKNIEIPEDVYEIVEEVERFPAPKEEPELTETPEIEEKEEEKK